MERKHNAQQDKTMLLNLKGVHLGERVLEEYISEVWISGKGNLKEWNLDVLITIPLLQRGKNGGLPPKRVKK